MTETWLQEVRTSLLGSGPRKSACVFFFYLPEIVDAKQSSTADNARNEIMASDAQAQAYRSRRSSIEIFR